MNYIGSKLSLLPFLETSITAVVGADGGGGVDTFCDLFAGTGIVGRYFKKKGYRIIANDLQHYSYVLNRHYIANVHSLPFLGLQSVIPTLASLPFSERANLVCDYLQNLPPIKGFIYNNYCQGDKKSDEDFRLYFSNENGAKCDAIRICIENWYSKQYINEDEYYFLLASLLEAIDKVANTASVYGAYLKKLKASAQKDLLLVPAECISSEAHHSVYLSDANKLIQQIDCDILYLDPPYNQRQYASNYHLLETISRYDAPEIKGKTGMRDYSEQKSLYCQKRLVAQTFEDLVKKAKCKYIFLSYNDEGLMSLDEIERIMSRYGAYGRFEQQYTRFQADKPSDLRNIKSNTTIEYLHYLIRQ